MTKIYSHDILKTIEIKVALKLNLCNIQKARELQLWNVSAL